MSASTLWEFLEFDNPVVPCDEFVEGLEVLYEAYRLVDENGMFADVNSKQALGKLIKESWEEELDSGDYDYIFEDRKGLSLDEMTKQELIEFIKEMEKYD